MAPRILIFGAGSIGGVYSYLLSRAVPASNITVTCRSNYDAVSKHGFTVNSSLWGKGLNVRPSVVRNVTEAIQAKGGEPFDYVLVTSKALNTTPSTAELIKPAVSSGTTTIVLIQNGIDTEAPFAKLYPENPILTTVVYLPATQVEPGVIEHQEVELLHIGTYPASAPQPHKAAAQAFSDLLTAAKASSKVHDDVQAERWSKLIVNASWNSICALTRCRDRQLLDITNQSGPFKDFIRGVMLEIAATAQAYGYASVNEELVEFQLQRACVRSLPGIQPSMMADALAGRNIEVDAIVGNTVRLAADKGVSTPMLSTIYFLGSGLDESFTLARPTSTTPPTWLWDARLLPAPFSYPYGTDHRWDMNKYRGLIAQTKSPRAFQPAYSFDDDNSHVAVVTQAAVQDVVWLDDAASEIASIKFPAYFVNSGQLADADTMRFHVVIPLTAEFRERFDSAWRRLTKVESFELLLFDDEGDDTAKGHWDCKIVDHPGGAEALAAHPTEKHELVLFVRRPLPGQSKRGPSFPVKSFGDRTSANAALLRGTGFYGFMAAKPAVAGADDSATAMDALSLTAKLRQLPVVDLLGSDEYADAVVEEALPADRQRFRAYMSERLLDSPS
ncbi:2-dehydropantoate 2-reductase [Diaporthe helianthi]|uniref:2-dehydropantoate 2-reductase n=1 Tax=Diaporthe helianthi TaxID=158607 RepID=A0A2P5HQ91_DIAHE|nr:2-dehydropantoate 2-reductase [Diaporthe helianthi]